MSKKKALEWGRIKDLDHNKVHEEAKQKADKAAAKVPTKVVKKNRGDIKGQNTERATPGSAPDAPRQESTPAGASPGKAKARESQPQPNSPKPLACLGDPTADLATTKSKSPPKPEYRENQNQTCKPPTTRKATAEAKKKANGKLKKKSRPPPQPVKFPQLISEEIDIDVEDEDEVEIISPVDKKQIKIPEKKNAQDTQKKNVAKITRVATPGTTPHPYSREGRAIPKTTPKPEGNRKPRRPTDPEPEVVILGSKRKIISREKRSDLNGKGWDNTKKNIRSILRLREKQKVYVTKDEKTGKRGGPDQDAINLQERMLQNHEIVILKEGQAGLVRDMTQAFKVRHGEEKLNPVQRARSRQKRKEKEARDKENNVPPAVPADGHVMHHVRLQKKRFLGKPVRKHLCGFAYEMRVARAKQRLEKESFPPLKKSVRIKPKDGRPSYTRHDPRIIEAMRNLRYEKRTQTPHDKSINKDFNEFVKKNLEDIKCVDLGDTDESETEIDNLPTPAPHLKVSLNNFLEAPNQMGNCSGEESDYDEDGTNILIKEEEQSEDSDAEGGYCHPNDKYNNRTRSVSTQVVTQTQTCSTATQYDTGMGSSETSSEDDEEDPPTEEVAKTARQLVVFNATHTFNSDLETAMALFQSLAKSKYNFKTADGTKKTCGIDFLNLIISKDAKVKIKNKQKRKGTGKKSPPGHIIAQEPDTDVLEIEISNDDKQLVKNHDPPAGSSDQAGERGRDRRKKIAIPHKVLGDGGKKKETKRKRESSKRDKCLKFYHEKHTDEDDIARSDWPSHQLLVLGLSKTHGKRPPPGGPQV